MYSYSFERLKVWQEVRSLTKEIYQLTKDFPKEEMFGIKSQIRRATISVGLNIAEGSGMITGKDQARMYKVAYGSLMEVVSALIFSSDLGYISPGQVEKTRELVFKISNQLNALSKAARNKRINDSTHQRFNP